MKKIICLIALASLLVACDKDGGRETFAPSTLLLSGYEAVDLGLSVKWASCNIGADEPYKSGDFFAWGETATKEIYNFDDYVHPKVEALPGDKDAAKVLMGGNWRMPTETEVQELIDNCNWRCVCFPKTKVYGYKVSNKSNSRQYIFLPFAGHKDNRSYTNDNKAGCYWTSEADGAYPYVLTIYKSANKDVKCQNAYPTKGYPIRAVSD